MGARSGGRIGWINARARRSRDQEEPSTLVGSFWRELWTEQQRAAAVECFDAASGDRVERFSGALQPDLGGAWLDVVLAPIHDAEGSVARLLAIGRDITEQRRVAEERDRLTSRLEETPEVQRDVRGRPSVTISETRSAR